jgi:hypothetical protein
VRLDLATERLSEVEELIERSHLQAIGQATGQATGQAPGVFAAGLPSDITDPKLVALIEDALIEAGRHLEAAADILTKERSTAKDLDELVEVSQRGYALATELAQDLPNRTQPPVLHAVVKMAKIEAAAKAARTKVEPESTPPPCATPTATPEPTTTPETDEAEDGENATSTAVTTEAPVEVSTPEPTPCVSPKPTPTPEPTDTPTPEPSTEPTTTPGVEEGVESNSDGEDLGSEGNDPSTASESGTEPHSA